MGRRLAERVGFEPTKQVCARLRDFQSRSFDQTRTPLRAYVKRLILASSLGSVNLRRDC